MNGEIEVIVDPFNGRASIQKIKKEIKTEIRASSGGSSSSPGGQVNSIVAGNNITVDSSDPVNPIVASTASGGVSIGDTIGGAPANGGILYADSSDLLKADKFSIESNSYFGGLVTTNSIADQSSSSLPKIGFVDASGAGGSYGVGVTTNNTAAVNYLMIDVSNLSAKAQLLFDPVTAANSNFTVALANGLAGTPELQVTTTAVDIHQPLDMNSKKITGLAAGTTNGDAVRYEQVVLQSLADAKGDLIVGSAADTITRLAAGTDGYFLKTNSATATGLEWVTAPTASPGGSDTQVQYNDSGAFGGDAHFTFNETTNRITLGASGVDSSILLQDVGKQSAIALGPQGNWGTDFAQDEPHIALNTVRLIGNGGNALLLRNGSNTNNITIFSDKIAVNSYVTPSNGITGFFLTENGGNNSATITMASTDQSFFGRVARLLVQPESGLVTDSASIDAIRAKAQTSQTGKLFRGVNTSNNEVFSVGVAGDVVINEQGNDADTRIEGDTDANLFFTDASTDRVGVGTNAPAEKLEVNGTVRADGLRLDLTPTAETITPTHTITISVNGTNYKIPLQAA